MEFKDWLKQELNKRNISNKGFSIFAEVTESAVSRYLNGQYQPSLRILLKLAKEWEMPEKEVLRIGGYDENYKRIPKKIKNQLRDEESITDESQETTDEKLLRLSRYFPEVFLDKFDELDEDEKLDIIDIFTYLLDKKRKEKEGKK